jgi:menaquinol-cytochrome c reductase iron-sulfur subunit
MDDVSTPPPRAIESPTRRTFHVAAIYALMGAISTALGVPALVYLFFPPKAKKSQEWIEIGDIARLTPNAPVEMTFRRNRVDGWKVVSEKSTAWVVKTGESTVTAFGPQCTHLGCAYHWEEGRNQFLCPCHTSLFGLDGNVLSGPAPRPLDRYETKLDGGKLFLGKLKPSTEHQV